MVQLGIIASNNHLTAPELDSYMQVIVSNIQRLSIPGMKILKNGELIYSNVRPHLLLVTGDSVQALQISHIPSLFSEYHCKFCDIPREEHNPHIRKHKDILIKNQNKAKLRTKQDYLHEEEYFGIKGSPPIAQLHNFSVAMFGIDCFHLVSGIGLFMVELLTV
ncbi:hypothetical protein, partial, partial [Parasitella parasitica]